MGCVDVRGWLRRRRDNWVAARRIVPAAIAGDPPGPPPRRRWAYATVLVFSSLVVSTWFRAGTFISTGDMGAFIRRGWTPEMAWSWNHQISGGGSAAHTIGRAFEFGLIDFVGLFGFDETVAQWLFYTIIYGSVAFKEALLICWRSANEICAENLQPFMPELVYKLESCGELNIDTETRELLLSASIGLQLLFLSPHIHRTAGTTRDG